MPERSLAGRSVDYSPSPLPSGRAAALVVAGLLAGALLANLAQLPAMENNDRQSDRAFVRSDTASMAAIGLVSSPTVRERRGLYLWLSELAPGAQVIVGPDSGLDIWQLYGLAGVRRVVATDTASDEILADMDVGEHVVVDDGDGRYGPVPFTIALADAAPTALVVRVVGDRHDVIDVRLLPETARADVLR